MTFKLIQVAEQSMNAPRLIPTDAKKLDEVDQYFECIAECPPADPTCNAQCVTELKEDQAQLNVPSY